MGQVILRSFLCWLLGRGLLGGVRLFDLCVGKGFMGFFCSVVLSDVGDVHVGGYSVWYVFAS